MNRELRFQPFKSIPNPYFEECPVEPTHIPEERSILPRALLTFALTALLSGQVAEVNAQGGCVGPLYHTYPNGPPADILRNYDATRIWRDGEWTNQYTLDCKVGPTPLPSRTPTPRRPLPTTTPTPLPPGSIALPHGTTPNQIKIVVERQSPIQLVTCWPWTVAQAVGGLIGEKSPHAPARCLRKSYLQIVPTDTNP